LVQRLRYDARSNTKDVSEALSITPRMADYRIEKLLSSGALSVRAMINTQKQEGLIFYELEMSVDAGKTDAVIGGITERYGERVWSLQPNAGVLLVNLFAFNLGEPEEAAMDSMKLEGVGRCSPFILKEIVEPQRPSWIDNSIQEKIASLRAG
jgi:DNA-binding Lrp family transcriptional regulator